MPTKTIMSNNFERLFIVFPLIFPVWQGILNNIRVSDSQEFAELID